jgi:hypothetical protein
LCQTSIIGIIYCNPIKANYKTWNEKDYGNEQNFKYKNTHVCLVNPILWVVGKRENDGFYLHDLYNTKISKYTTCIQWFYKQRILKRKKPLENPFWKKGMKIFSNLFPFINN